MNGGCTLHAFERTIYSRDSILPRPFRTRLQIRLIDLHNVGSRRKQVVDFFVDRCCVIESHFLFALVEIVLRLLRHRKWTWNRHLDHPAGIGSEELKVSYLYGMLATNPPNDARHSGWDDRCGQAPSRDSPGPRRPARWQTG